MLFRTFSISLCLALAAGAAGARAGQPAGAGREAPAAPSEPPAGPSLELDDVLGRLYAELALLGAAPDEAPDRYFLPGDNLPPLRELCLHARELYRKADRLARSRRAAAGPPLPRPSPQPGVELLRALIEASVARLQEARGSAANAPMAVAADTPVQVLTALRAADRALAELLVLPPTHGDVHRVVTRALAYASAVRVRFPGRRIPLAPPEEDFATNDAVYAALVRCWTQVEDLLDAGGLQPVSHRPLPEALEVSLERLHALASLLRDELELLYLRHGDPERLAPTGHPGERRTTALLQRVELLGRQLRELQDLAATRDGEPPEEEAR